MNRPRNSLWHAAVLVTVLITVAAVYWPGLQGSFLFDDYPNIVDNQGVQPSSWSIPSLVRSALSSPSSELRRPLASLSFAVNYLATGINPYWMKLTNLVIHLLNGWLVFILARMLLWLDPNRQSTASAGEHGQTYIGGEHKFFVPVLITAGWMLLPINLTAVLYVVQRMESMANAFVLLGLIGYVAGRRRMLNDSTFGNTSRGFWLCMMSLIGCTAVGIMAKETAVMLPLYAFLIEWIVFRFRHVQGVGDNAHADRRISALFIVVLVIPMAIGLAWLLPAILRHSAWATRDFNLYTRLLSEARIVVDYVAWTLLPTPNALSFYHDNYQISTGLLQPWTTLTSLLAIAGMVAAIFWLRARKPLVALGLALFLGCQLLTSTIIPLELIYEHRNYFASFGLMLAVTPLLAAHRDTPFAMPRRILLGGLLLAWATLTGLTAYAWGNPLRLAEDLAIRAPLSPRAQYGLGRVYIVYSHYDPASPFTKLAYAPLEHAAALPGSSILPEQALIYMNARMGLPIKSAWWDSLIYKLKRRKPGVQDESSLGTLTQCADDGKCQLPERRMVEAYLAALSHPHPSARLLATYGDYAWNTLGDYDLGLRMTVDAVSAAPKDPAYRVTLARMYAASGNYDKVAAQLNALHALNIGGQLTRDIAGVEKLMAGQEHSKAHFHAGN